MKKSIIITLAVLLFAAAVGFVVTGFTTVPSAFIHEVVSVSEDGSELTFNAAVGSSMGFIRGFADKKEDHAHYLKFYSAWGGFNSFLGAKSEYVLKIDPDDTEIYVWHGTNGYELALHKDAETGEWTR